MALRIEGEEEDIFTYTKKFEGVDSKFIINVPVEMVSFLNGMINDNKKLLGNNEFAALYKAKKRKGLNIIDIDMGSLKVPNQFISPAYVELEGASTDYIKEYNGILHRHPSGFRKFSTTDARLLNSQFMVSFIFIPPMSFPDAIVNIELADGTLLQIPAECNIIAEEEVMCSYSSVYEGFIPSGMSRNSKLVLNEVKLNSKTRFKTTASRLPKYTTKKSDLLNREFENRKSSGWHNPANRRANTVDDFWDDEMPDGCYTDEDYGTKDWELFGMEEDEYGDIVEDRISYSAGKKSG